MVKLNAKQKLFCQEYIVDLNATQAAIRAGYSEKTACAIGTENLRKPNIAEFIQQLADERSKRVEVDADWVLAQAVDMFKTCKELGELLVACGNPAKGFLELAGKHCKINAFKENLDHTSSDGSMTPSKITRVIIDES